MPEIKHDFSAGKMNKDLDERLVPQGEYRDAMNIQVRTTSAEEGATSVTGPAGNAGTVQNIKGNKEIKSFIYNETPYIATKENLSTTTIASVSNEKTNTAYFLVAGAAMDEMLKDDVVEWVYTTYQGTAPTIKKFIDYIIEVNTGTGESDPTTKPVVVDKWGLIGVKKSILNEAKFSNLPSGDYNSDEWFEFPVDESIIGDIRIGMKVEVYTDNIETGNLLNENAFIQDILQDSGGVWRVYLRGQQDAINWLSVKFFTFRAERTLSFNIDTKITGINIIDDLLFWTDNETEPKKINITRCKEGTPDIERHTKLVLSDPIDKDILLNFTNKNGDGTENTDSSLVQSITPFVNNDLKEEHITVIRRAPKIAPTLDMKSTDREGQVDVFDFFYDFANWDNSGQNSITDNIAQGETFQIPSSSDLNGSTTQNEPDTFNNVNYREGDILKFKQSVDGSFISAIIVSVLDNDDGYRVITLKVLTVSNDSLFLELDENGNSTIPGIGSWNISLEQRKPLFELKMVQFGSRYKYEDGECSSFGPWSEIAFLPGNFDYNNKKGYNLGMVNTLRSLKIKNFIPHQRVLPNDVVAIDILYKTVEAEPVYIVKTIERGKDHEWDLFTTIPNFNENLAFGELTITTEMVHKILAKNQLYRVWDNVPRKALAQEIVANRLVYSNYEQGYDLKEQVGLKQILESKNTPSKTNPEKSIKSIRDYKWGMVFGDKYGRETPVIAPGFLTGDSTDDFTLISGDINIEKRLSSWKNTFKMEQDWSVNNGFPDDWISYVKYYVKETTNEYYNLVMDRWYLAEDGNVWLTFNSADRNKLDEETYLILKNEHGQDFPVAERARYKILAIENEAPSFIKRTPRKLGSVQLGSTSFPSMWLGDEPDQEDALNLSPVVLMNSTEIKIGGGDWVGFLDGYGDMRGDLEIRIWAEGGDTGNLTTVRNNTWRLVTYHHRTEESPFNAVVRWDRPFFEDADMLDLMLATGLTTPLASMQYYMEFREMTEVNKPEFDGKFFVKIEKDEILSSKVLGLTSASTSYDTIAMFDIAYIDNQEYNPSLLNSVYAGAQSDGQTDYMPRRNYKWFSTSSNTENVGPYNLAYGVANNMAGGNENIGMQNVTNTAWTDSNDMDWTWGGSDSNGGAGASGGQINGVEIDQLKGAYCAGTSSLTDGCHSKDAALLGLGCGSMDSSLNAAELPPGTSSWKASFEPQINSSNIIFNRARETAAFWYWYRFVASNKQLGGFRGAHGATIFIDGMRTASTGYASGGTISPPSYSLGSGGGGWIDVGDEGLGNQVGDGVVSSFWPYLYFKQTGFDAGRLTDTSNSAMEVNPTTSSGTFGRVVFSTFFKFDAEQSSDESVFKQLMTQPGTLFKFNRDPSNSVYKVVGSTIFNMRNHMAVDPTNGYGSIGQTEVYNVPSAPNQLMFADSYFNNDGFSQALSKIPWYNHHQILYGTGTLTYGSGSYGGTSTSNAGDVLGTVFQAMNTNLKSQHILNWTNFDPVFDTDPVSSETEAIDENSYYTVGGFSDVRIGGIHTDSDPLSYMYYTFISYPDNYLDCATCDANFTVNSISDGYDPFTAPPWAYTYGDMLFDSATTGNQEVIQYQKTCVMCGQSPNEYGYGIEGGVTGSVNMDQYNPTCIREGVRIEFRKFNTSTGMLEAGQDGLPGSVGLDPTIWDPRGAICHDGREAMKLSIITPTVTNPGEVIIPVSDAAVWETEPKEDVGLDIYYEASDAIPMILNSGNTTNFVPYGSKVDYVVYQNGEYVLDTGFSIVNSLGYTVEVFYIGYTKTHSVIGLTVEDINQSIDNITPLTGNTVTDMLNGYLLFTHPNGTITMSKLVEHMQPVDKDGNNTVPDHISETYFLSKGTDSTAITGYFKIDSDVYKFPIELGWSNCWSFGNGLESDRIRDDFNAVTTSNGVRVSSTFLDYGKERKGSGMIYSGIYNSQSGTNELNEFNMSEKITKDINPAYGSIQALKTRDTDIVVFTEDKTLRVVANKDALFNADGNPQMISTNRVLGTAVPFAGDYGISNNPESLAWDQYRMYFTDMQRGAVLRLSQDGLTPISNVGMKTWFRDNLKMTKSLLGTFDVVNGEYNLTLDYGAENSKLNKSVSFNEGGKGWVSFKSFVPQAGTSVGGKYITALGGGIWEHHVDIVDNNENSSTFNKVINRNTFYGEGDSYFTPSTLTVLFNDMPSQVKSFRAVSYEGSQAKVEAFTDYSETNPDGTPLYIEGDNEYYNLTPKDGWWVSGIETNLSYRGKVRNFKNKENKWFNRIDGDARTEITTQDLEEFSVQGLGQNIGVDGFLADEPQQVSITINSDMINDPDNTSTEEQSLFD